MTVSSLHSNSDRHRGWCLPHQSLLGLFSEHRWKWAVCCLHDRLYSSHTHTILFLLTVYFETGLCLMAFPEVSSRILFPSKKNVCDHQLSWANWLTGVPHSEVVTSQPCCSSAHITCIWPYTSACNISMGSILTLCSNHWKTLLPRLTKISFPTSHHLQVASVFFSAFYPPTAGTEEPGYAGATGCWTRVQSSIYWLRWKPWFTYL
jgi:hypothetical protein